MGRWGRAVRRRQGENSPLEESRYVNDDHAVAKDTKMAVFFSRMQLLVRSVSVCLIDDSGNRDVPLLDLSLTQLLVSSVIAVQL